MTNISKIFKTGLNSSFKKVINDAVVAATPTTAIRASMYVHSPASHQAWYAFFKIIVL